MTKREFEQERVQAGAWIKSRLDKGKARLYKARLKKSSTNQRGSSIETEVRLRKVRLGVKYLEGQRLK